MIAVIYQFLHAKKSNNKIQTKSTTKIKKKIYLEKQRNPNGKRNRFESPWYLRVGFRSRIFVDSSIDHDWERLTLAALTRRACYSCLISYPNLRRPFSTQLSTTDLNSRITLIVPAQEMQRQLSIFYSPARGGGHTPTIGKLGKRRLV